MGKRDGKDRRLIGDVYRLTNPPNPDAEANRFEPVGKDRDIV